MITLGFHLWGSDLWTRGTYDAADLMRALHQTFGAAVSVKLLLRPGQTPPALLTTLADETLTYPSPPARYSAPWWRERIPRRVLHHDPTPTRFLRAHKIDVLVFGDAPFGSRIPTIHLVPDFQPFYLPEYFPPRELAHRRAEVFRLGATATRLIVYGEAVRADVAHFVPQFLAKTRIVTPLSDIPESVYALDPVEVLRADHLPERFLFVPNQFWQHKNHTLVLDALTLLRARGVRPTVVMTGLYHDDRAPEYASTFFRRVSELDLRDQVLLLGLVPRAHVYALMRLSLAVLNPSLFEGYGMTVAEARWLGKRALLSDIPAHRAQNPPHALYFDPRDPVALADCLQRAWESYSPGPDLELEDAARRAYPAHVRACAQEFMNVVQELVP